ncbi:hypothetical protein BDN67DRAFT_533111 [Paxillus ammoniavirescens]|nr:hypothetical protein BDN67DRAFT_533111 [Paxillus ammoniavirescens]
MADAVDPEGSTLFALMLTLAVGHRQAGISRERKKRRRVEAKLRTAYDWTHRCKDNCTSDKAVKLQYVRRPLR